jgi:RNA polymerase sigma-70 factor (ECF subfamily)
MDGHCPHDDAQWLAAARRGEREAFGRLYRRHAPAVYGLALRVLGDAASAEDVAQDVFLSMLDKADTLREPERLRSWLKRAAANACIDLLRKRRPDVDPGQLEFLECPQPTPEARSGLPPEFEALPAIARSLVWLFVVEGWTHPELAERFGRSESWSKSIVSRALARLRAQIDPLEER